MGSVATRGTTAPRGFTLVEILVVLIVIGIAAGLAYAQLARDPRQALDREGRRLGMALEHAAQLAQWNSQTLGFSAAAGGYQFWRRADNDQWSPLSNDDVLQYRLLPDTWTAAPLMYAGQPVPVDTVLPLHASGRNEPFVIELASPQWRVLLAADPLNRVEITGPLQR